jgi:hypothetical protein
MQQVSPLHAAVDEKPHADLPMTGSSPDGTGAQACRRGETAATVPRDGLQWAPPAMRDQYFRRSEWKVEMTMTGPFDPGTDRPKMEPLPWPDVTLVLTAPGPLPPFPLQAKTSARSLSVGAYLSP